MHWFVLLYQMKSKQSPNPQLSGGNVKTFENFQGAEWTKSIAACLRLGFAKSATPPRFTQLVFTSHWFSPLAKDIVDEFGHGLGAAVAPPVGSVLEVLHHLPDELGEEVGDVLVALGRWHLLEVTAVLMRQAAGFLLSYLACMAKVLLVTHQTYGNVRVPETVRLNR